MSSTFQRLVESGKVMRWSFGVAGAGVLVSSFLSKVPQEHVGLVHHYKQGLSKEVLTPGWHITVPFYTTVMLIDQRETMSLGIPVPMDNNKEVELILRPDYVKQVQQFSGTGSLRENYKEVKEKVGEAVQQIFEETKDDEERKDRLESALTPLFSSYGFDLLELEVVE